MSTRKAYFPPKVELLNTKEAKGNDEMANATTLIHEGRRLERRAIRDYIQRLKRAAIERPALYDDEVIATLASLAFRLEDESDLLPLESKSIA